MIYNLALLVSLAIGLAAAYIAVNGGPWFWFLGTSILFFLVSIGGAMQNKQDDDDDDPDPLMHRHG